MLGLPKTAMRYNTTLSNTIGGSHSYIAPQPEQLFYESTGIFSASRLVTLSHGQVLFKVTPERGRSRTTSVCDASGTPLFEFRFETHWFKPDTYSAYSLLSGVSRFNSNLLWEMNRKDHRATSKCNMVSVATGAPGNNSGDLIYRQRYRGRIGGELLRGGLVLAKVDRISMWSKKYVIEVLPHIDMALVVGIVAAVEHKVKNEGGAT
jgi:hypothetical protein